ncbi:MAG: glycine cleavage system protein GcvH [Chloroflexi bacterium]|jgi:glycine cleavage system H protein|nr:glycine cleavage system protein GcvH [Chloroflexota bacterium]
MPVIRGCNIPEDRYYWVEKHVWAIPEPDGTVKIGITDVAQNLAKGIVNITPKEPGRTVQKGKSAGTLESGKWVGPVTSPVTGEIVEVNEAARARPSLLNEDPYGEGWFVKIKPSNWEAESASLVTGAEAVEAYRKFMEEQNLSCG